MNGDLPFPSDNPGDMVAQENHWVRHWLAADAVLWQQSIPEPSHLQSWIRTHFMSRRQMESEEEIHTRCPSLYTESSPDQDSVSS
jgi:hypothetical protein